MTFKILTTQNLKINVIFFFFYFNFYFILNHNFDLIYYTSKVNVILNNKLKTCF